MRMSQDAAERERYESRLKFNRDQQQFEADALERGRQVGREEGAFYGEISTLQFVMKLPQTPKEELAKLSLDELQRLADDLRQRVIATS